MEGIQKIRLSVNGTTHTVEVDGNMPLLWVLRDELGLLGTKYGCGAGLCGACSVLIDGVARRSCLQAVGTVNSEITTIEGLDGMELADNIQQEWVSHQVAQCGYCQPGQIIQAFDLLSHKHNPTEEDITNAMNGNLCRCGTYSRISTAIKAVLNKNGTSRQEKEPD